MPSIHIKDDLRAAVEAATGGLCTVFYSASGQPCFMRAIPRYNLEDIDPALGTGPAPGFVVNGVAKDVIWIGQYAGVIRNGELLSMPGVDPTASLAYTAFVTAARATGPGFHVMTNAEWAAVALLCAKQGYQPRGNTSHGRAHDMLFETCPRQDGAAPGTAGGTARAPTGSGPMSWRHDNSTAGIEGLVGNVWELTPGLRVVDGEIQVIENNDAASLALFDDTAAWKAIKASDGTLVAPGTAGTLKYDSLAAWSDNATVNGLGNLQIDSKIDFRNGMAGDDGYTGDYNSMAFSALSAEAGVNIPAIAKALLLAPSLALSGSIYMRNHGKRYPLRGGGWDDGLTAGLGAMLLSHPASHARSNLGARLAKV